MLWLLVCIEQVVKVVLNRVVCCGSGIGMGRIKYVLVGSVSTMVLVQWQAQWLIASM